MLKNFFNRFYFEDYIPHVRHIFYPILVMAVGVRLAVFDNQAAYGITTFILGALLFIVITIGIAWRGPIEYWRQIEAAVKVMLRINSPELWFALGFKEVPEVTQQKEYIDRGPNVAPGIKYNQVLTQDLILLNTIANKVLLSGKTDFTEELYGKIVKGRYAGGWSKFIKDFKISGYVTRANNHPKSKHVLTHKGMAHVYQYADQTIKLQVMKEKLNASNSIEE